MEGKITKDLQTSSVAYGILEYAFFTPVVRLSDCNLAFSGVRSYRSVGAAFRKLIGRGYLERIPGTEEKEGLFRMSEEGLLYIKRNGTEEEQAYYRAASPSRTRLPASAARAWVKHNPLHAAVCSTGACTYPSSKPSFADTVRYFAPVAESIPESEDSPGAWYAPVGKEELISLASESGIWYSSLEMRRGLDRLGIRMDSFSMSRFKGVFFRRGRIYVLYYCDADYFRWYRAAELNLVAWLKGMFGGTALLSEGSSPVCVMTGKNTSLIPAFVTGYVHGRNRTGHMLDGELEALKEDDSPEAAEKKEALRRQKEQAGWFATAKHAHKAGFFRADTPVYSEAFYCPVALNCAGKLADVLSGDSSSLQKAGNRWIAEAAGRSDGSIPVKFRQGSSGLTCGTVASDGTPVAFLPAADLKALSQLRGRGGKVAVVTEPYLAEAISKSLGPVFSAAYDLGGREIPAGRYDANGYSSDGPDRYEELGKKMKEKAREEKNPEGGRSVAVSLSLTETQKAYIEQYAKEHGMTMSGAGRKLMDIAIESERKRTDETL